MTDTTPEESRIEAPTKPDRQELKREVIDFVKLVVWFLVIFIGLRQYVIEGYEVQGPSMQPTLENNERILVLKLPHIISKWPLFEHYQAINPGDIVVFDSPDTANKRYVKRVIAHGPKDTSDGNTVAAGTQGATREGDVSVRFEKGSVYVNNRLVNEDYIRHDDRDTTPTQELTLGAGEYYVLGDNRKVSKDSRSFGSIDDDTIIGKAFLRFWPPSKISLLR